MLLLLLIHHLPSPFSPCGSCTQVETGCPYSVSPCLQAGVHPEQPSNTVDRAAFERIWRHCVLLLQRGFKTGSILTVDPEEADKLGRPWTRRSVHRQQSDPGLLLQAVSLYTSRKQSKLGAPGTRRLSCTRCR